MAWRSAAKSAKCLPKGVCEAVRMAWVKISQIRTLSVKRLGKKLGRISVEELNQVVEGLSEIIGA